MTDQEKTQLLSNILHELLGPQLAGKFMVEVKATVTIDAKDTNDAKQKALQMVKDNPDQLKAFAIKVDDLLGDK